MCGVMPWCGMVRHGWSAGAGCGYQVVVEQVPRLRVQRRVDGDHVTVRHHLLGAGVECQPELLLHLGRQPVTVGVVQPHLSDGPIRVMDQ
jgi:hypothetical protein